MTAAFVGIATALHRQNYIDPIIREDEPTSTSLGRNLGGNGSHTCRKNRGHKTGALRINQFHFPNRLTSNKRSAHDQARKLFESIWLVGLANEIAAGRTSRPCLPGKVCRR
jgi:hypothetical protein